MALTRARVICGDPGLGTDTDAMLHRVLRAGRDAGKLATDVLDMRARMLQQHRGDQIWDLKHFRGGQVDLDFIAQFLQLRHAHDHPGILARPGGEVFARARDLGLLSSAAADPLIEIGRFWRQLQQMIRLLVGAKVDEATLSEPTRRHLAASAGVDSFDALKAMIRERAAVIHRLFQELIGPEGR